MSNRVSNFGSLTITQIKKLRELLEKEYRSSFDSPNVSIINPSAKGQRARIVTVMAIRGASLPAALDEVSLKGLIEKAMIEAPAMDFAPDYALQNKVVMATGRRRH